MYTVYWTYTLYRIAKVQKRGESSVKTVCREEVKMETMLQD